MKFLRNNWYWMLSIVIGLSVGSIITMHRVQQQESETEQPLPDVAAHTPDVTKAPNVEVSRKHRPIRINKAARNTPALKNIGPIPAAEHDDIIEPPPPLPMDIQMSLEKLRQEMLVVGEMYEIRNGEKFITEEAHKRRLEILAGDMNPEEAIDYLEKHGYYNEAILSQVSAHRAFKYLEAIRASWKKVNEYAEKALTESPDNFEAKMHLILYEKDNAKAAAGYREILAKDPNHVGALLNLGYRTHYDDPEGALEHLIKGNKLDPTLGFSAIGMVYERLGDVKTAWLYYRKHLTLWPTDPYAESHLSWINAGKPKYTPIQLERQLVPQRAEASKDKGTIVPKEKRIPETKEMPWYPELPPQETHPPKNQMTTAEAARAEFQRRHAAAQKEFDAFMDWAESIMREDAVSATNDFLAKELAAHLKGDKTEVTPERLVRAFEMIERHGRIRGLQRLKDKDPGLAAEVQRFLEEKQQPSRRNNQQNKNE